ncbi:MAG: hypothetical protein EA383_10925 [Spirochaetaceae bacterium]|nr:MAG: hypothetical protein EA383_10925 [Spirochaetaceae bacterium]
MKKRTAALAAMIGAICALAAFATPASLLVSATEAETMLGQSSVVFVDVRPVDAFETAHIPGAVQVYRPDLSASAGSYEFPGMRISRDGFYDLLGSLGISADTLIIAYTDSAYHDAFRFAWLARLYGHEQVRVLDVPFDAWVEARLPVASGRSAPSAIGYEAPGAASGSMLASRDDVIAAQRDPNTIVVDTRTTAEFWGVTVYAGATRRGHIPGAVHLNYTMNFDEHGVLDRAALRTQFEAAGITPDRNIIVYCHVGGRAAMTNLILSDVLGYPNVRSYDGSWVEWSYMRDGSVVSYFLYLTGAVFFIAIVSIGLVHWKRIRSGKDSALDKVDGAIGIAFTVFLIWYFNLFSLVSMDRIGELQAWIESFGFAGPIVFIMLFALGTLFFLPGTPFAIIAGVVFGPLLGSVYALTGATIGASLAMLAGRYAFRSYAEKLVEKNPGLRKIDDGVVKHGWRMLMITRFVPVVPFNVQNYVYGLTRIPFWTYAVLSMVFMSPGTAAYVFIAGAAVSGANIGTIMTYFAIAAVLLVGLSLLPGLLKKKSGAADILG